MKFIFKGHDSNLEKGEIFFHYSFQGEQNIDFTEKLSFPPIKDSNIPQDLLKNILDGLFLILGVSYWKLYCPKQIILESMSLTKKQTEFWNTVYTKGMGEFYYKNKIDFRKLVSFPSAEQNIVDKTVSYTRRERTLLGVGGGKDSIVAAEILRESGKEFELATSGFPIQIEIAQLIGKKTINTFRKIDPKLLELNKEKDVYNGHIPISVYYAFLLLFLAILFDYGYIVVGNEKSADSGNVEYLGEIINHQWSKTSEFEKLFNEYIKNFITPDIIYFSPLREMTELQVVEKFAQYPKYFKTFSSCNKNFKITAKASSKWCGECPKCLFIFICLAAFLPKKDILEIFGKNLLEDKKLTPLFEELIGIRNFKPFECVGTQEETREALRKILEREEFNEAALIKHFKSI